MRHLKKRVCLPGRGLGLSLRQRGGQLGVWLTAEETAILDDICERSKISRSAVVRGLIRAAKGCAVTARLEFDVEKPT